MDTGLLTDEQEFNLVVTTPDAPTAVDDLFIPLELGPWTFAQPGVLVNDINPSTATLISTTSPPSAPGTVIRAGSASGRHGRARYRRQFLLHA